MIGLRSLQAEGLNHSSRGQHARVRPRNTISLVSLRPAGAHQRLCGLCDSVAKPSGSNSFRSLRKPLVTFRSLWKGKINNPFSCRVDLSRRSQAKTEVPPCRTKTGRAEISIQFNPIQGHSSLFKTPRGGAPRGFQTIQQRHIGWAFAKAGKGRQPQARLCQTPGGTPNQFQISNQIINELYRKILLVRGMTVAMTMNFRLASACVRSLTPPQQAIGKDSL